MLGLQRSDGSNEGFRELVGSLTSVSGFQGFVIASSDGLPLHGEVLTGTKLLRAAATAAALVGTAEATADHLDLGGFEVAVLRCRRGDLLFLACGEEVIVVVLLERGADLGPVVDRAEKIGCYVQDILAED